jgi:hypothetical protein
MLPYSIFMRLPPIDMLGQLETYEPPKRLFQPVPQVLDHMKKPISLKNALAT